MLVQSCIRFLGPMEAELLQILFTLSQEGWQSVSGPCHTFLTSASICTDQQSDAGLGSPPANGKLPPCESRLSHAAISDVFHRLLKGLPEALAVGSLHGSVHAKKLTTAFQARACLIHSLHSCWPECQFSRWRFPGSLLCYEGRRSWRLIAFLYAVIGLKLKDSLLI